MIGLLLFSGYCFPYLMYRLDLLISTFRMSISSDKQRYVSVGGYWFVMWKDYTHDSKYYHFQMYNYPREKVISEDELFLRSIYAERKES